MSPLVTVAEAPPVSVPPPPLLVTRCATHLRPPALGCCRPTAATQPPRQDPPTPNPLLPRGLASPPPPPFKGVLCLSPLLLSPHPPFLLEQPRAPPPLPLGLLSEPTTGEPTFHQNRAETPPPRLPLSGEHRPRSLSGQVTLPLTFLSSASCFRTYHHRREATSHSETVGGLPG
jgi:hypothetical protein